MNVSFSNLSIVSIETDAPKAFGTSKILVRVSSDLERVVIQFQEMVTVHRAYIDTMVNNGFHIEGCNLDDPLCKIYNKARSDKFTLYQGSDNTVYMERNVNGRMVMSRLVIHSKYVTPMYNSELDEWD